MIGPIFKESLSWNSPATKSAVIVVYVLAALPVVAAVNVKPALVLSPNPKPSLAPAHNAITFFTAPPISTPNISLLG